MNELQREISFMNTVVRLDGLIKKYDNKPVVDGLTLDINEGEIFGFIFHSSILVITICIIIAHNECKRG